MAPGRRGDIICVRHDFSVWRYRLFQAESKEIFSVVAALAGFCDDSTIRTSSGSREAGLPLLPCGSEVLRDLVGKTGRQDMNHSTVSTPSMRLTRHTRSPQRTAIPEHSGLPMRILRFAACLITALALVLAVVAVDVSQYLNWKQPRFARPVQTAQAAHASGADTGVAAHVQRWQGLGYLMTSYTNGVDAYRAMTPLTRRNSMCVTDPGKVTSAVHRSLAGYHTAASIGLDDGFVGVRVMGCEGDDRRAVAYVVAVEQDADDAKTLHLDSCAAERVTLVRQDDGSIRPLRHDDAASDRSLGRCEPDAQTSGLIPQWVTTMWIAADQDVGGGA